MVYSLIASQIRSTFINESYLLWDKVIPHPKHTHIVVYTIVLVNEIHGSSLLLSSTVINIVVRLWWPQLASPIRSTFINESYLLWDTGECPSSTAGWATVSDTVVHINMNVVTGTVETTIGPPSPPPRLDGRCLHSLWLDWQLGKVRPRAAQELPILALHSSTLQRGIEQEHSSQLITDERDSNKLDRLWVVFTRLRVKRRPRPQKEGMNLVK